MHCTNYELQLWFLGLLQIWEFTANVCDRYYLGVHCNAPVPAIIGEFEWLNIKFQRYLNIYKFWNHIIKLEDVKLPKIVVNNDLNNAAYKGTWVNEIKS